MKNKGDVLKINSDTIEAKSSSHIIAMLNGRGKLVIFESSSKKITPIIIDNLREINSFSVFKSSFLAVSYWNSSIISIFHISQKGPTQLVDLDITNHLTLDFLSIDLIQLATIGNSEYLLVALSDGSLACFNFYQSSLNQL